MSIVFINPNLVVQKNDTFTTGIIYLPLAMAYTAASLRKYGHDVQVIDSFGEAPRQATHIHNFMSLGLTDEQLLSRIPDSAEFIFVYAINLINYMTAGNAVRVAKQKLPDVPVIVLENTQAVTAFTLSYVDQEFYKEGADFILTGEGEHRAQHLIELLTEGANIDKLQELDGLGSPDFFNPPQTFLTTQELDELPFPAWDLLPMENYWGLKFAHGPMKSDKYLSMLTSRGCPYQCGFCVNPSINQSRWRFRSASNVVDEMEFFQKTFGVSEFHIEDLNPTVSDDRTREICHEILDRGLQVHWKLVAGTKIETIRNEETLRLMASAGCTYISISPETGSPKVLKLIRKPFDLEHAIQMVKEMNQIGIFSQACFILGYPGEEEEDRFLTLDMVKRLTKIGVDEIAVFIITPAPGSRIYPEFKKEIINLSELNFSPTWREDYKHLNRWRLRLYRTFLIWKTIFHPIKILRQPFNFLSRSFNTKMEMVPYRSLVWQYIMRFMN
ncbi:MAG: B12-binding domain-containing radical SAM protein [Anaerolineales bacterium]|nr:B12-binding domain-containing radical SAM protein [Anaerolineales bacterium]